MSSNCILCNKKINFWDVSLYIEKSDRTKLLVCDVCYESYKKIMRSMDDDKSFYSSLEEFSNHFEYSKVCEEIVEDIIKQHDELNLQKNYKVNENMGPFENQDLVYTIEGVRGRHIDIYIDKVVITTRVTLGSVITHNATDGEKTIYYSDCIGIQFKQSKLTIGYLQLETASSNGNNKKSNFFDENSFTFSPSVVSNEKMIEVKNYVKSRIAAIKNGSTTTSETNILVSVADEILKFKQLLDMGVISQEEFDEQKNKLLKR